MSSTETTSSDITKETSSDNDEDRSNSDNSIYVTTMASDVTIETQAMSAEVTTSAEEVSIEGNNELKETNDIDNVGGEKMRKRDRLKRKLKQLIK